MCDVCRPWRRLFLLLLLTASVTRGQSPPLTTIADTVYRADRFAGARNVVNFLAGVHYERRASSGSGNK